MEGYIDYRYGGMPVGTYWNIVDCRGSILSTYKDRPNSFNDIQKKTYDAFGNMVDSGGLNINNPYGYNGEYVDYETGFVYLRARYYDPNIGRFTQEDTHRTCDTNLYSYCGNNPVVYSDPSGHCHESKDVKTLIFKENFAYPYLISDIAGPYRSLRVISTNSIGENTYEVTYDKCVLDKEHKEAIRISPNSYITKRATKELSDYYYPMQVSNRNGELSYFSMIQNAIIVRDILSMFGWSINAICAVLGNMQQESRINPGYWQGYGNGPGYGLVQWDPSSKFFNWANNDGFRTNCIVVQLVGIMSEMFTTNTDHREWWQTHISVPSQYKMPASDFIRSTKNVADLASIFMHCYERPGYPLEYKRRRYAQGWYDFFVNNGKPIDYVN